MFVLSRSLRSGIESDDGRKTLTPKKWASVIERVGIQSHYSQLLMQWTAPTTGIAICRNEVAIVLW